MIKFSAESNTFFLGTESSSYIIKILDNGLLCHKYYGAAVACDNFDYLNLFKKHEYMPDTVLNGVASQRTVLRRNTRPSAAVISEVPRSALRTAAADA